MSNTGNWKIQSKCPFEDGYSVHSKKTWFEAREDCIRRGTDLYVNENMDVDMCDLTKTTYGNTWIGIRNVKWIAQDTNVIGKY